MLLFSFLKIVWFKFFIRSICYEVPFALEFPISVVPVFDTFLHTQLTLSLMNLKGTKSNFFVYKCFISPKLPKVQRKVLPIESSLTINWNISSKVALNKLEIAVEMQIKRERDKQRNDLFFEPFSTCRCNNNYFA